MKKQTELSGMESPSIPEIETAADSYAKIRDKRMKLTEQEVTSKAALIEVVKAHERVLSMDGDGNRCYRFDDMIVILKHGKENVKVRTVHDGGDEEDEEDED